ncbi:TetR/AcrR family transcriptional regulator [Actinomadura violacea]|uniref:TetR/AcrR family transcriptional regulator n=1 Tax=Actinomadura violacea TaxID=2819934 RepID=A0ABS3S8A8_9ACTN|nr:TetR/AcrR family transcriptional regulator [Actinomadura violacea]MBO2465126.1 TetR/AcrR family transcriptional regulator [Actinomadura violacea]
MGTAVDPAGSRGRIDKRRAILDAAFAVFAREGYTQAGVDVIAAEAGVAKATVYNHFGDKETLLRRTIADLAEQALEQNLAAIERLGTPGDDLRALLEDVGLSLAHCYCDDRSWTLRRLLIAEFAQFPDLLDVIWGRVNDRALDALADRLARLTLAGRLRANDPVAAAEQFSALLSAPLDKRTRLGTRDVPEDEVRAVVTAAVATFLAAFAP